MKLAVRKLRKIYPFIDKHAASFGFVVCKSFMGND